MLKFRYNEEKRKAFLKFWELGKLEEFTKKALEPGFFYHYYQKLEPDDRKVIAKILDALKKDGKLEHGSDGLLFKQKDSAVNVRSLGSQEPVFARLDECHFINLHRSRENLGDHGDTVSLSNEFQDFLASLPWSKTAETNAVQIENLSIASDSDKKNLELIYTSYLFFNRLTLKVLDSLIKKNLISVCLGPGRRPALFSGSFPMDKNIKGPELFTLRERPAYFIFALNARLYEIATGSKGIVSKWVPAKYSPDTAFLTDLARKIFDSGRASSFVRRTFYGQYLWLMKNYFPGSMELCKELIKAAPQAEVLSKAELIRLYRKLSMNSKNKKFTADETGKYIDELKSIYLAGEGEGLSFDFKLCRTLFGTKTKSLAPEASKADAVLIDSDIRLNVHRDRMTPALFHLLLLTGEISQADYLYTVQFDMKKMPLAAFCGISPEHISSTLKKLSPNYWNETVAGHLRLMFGTVNAFSSKRMWMIETPSNETFMSAKFHLEQSKIPFEVHPSKKNALLISGSPELKKARELLRHHKVHIF